MIKTLYVRVIVFYIAAVLIGVLVAWVSALYLFEESAEQSLTAELTAKGNHILQLYNQAKPENSDIFLENAAQLASLGMMLTSENVPEPRYVNWPDEANSCNCDITIHQLWELDGVLYTVELIESMAEESSGLDAIAVILLIVLVIGSLIILLFARILVKPIMLVTTAARQLAGGNFNVRIPENGPGEIGQLSETINHMAAELGQLERERQEFVANVSHEFQSPLTVMKGYSSVLLEDQLDESERKRFAQIIMNESERLSKLSDNLLRLASLESDSMVIHLAHFDVSEQIRRTVLSFEPMWSSKQLEVAMNAEPTMIYADAELLSQVWYNLMSNAIKFTPAGGRITISVQADMREVVVQFFDNGIPISATDKEKVFNRFFKADCSRDRSIEGNGLGLFIVKKIVTLHKGSIQIQEQGKGKAFIVTLNYEAFYTAIS